MPHNRAPREQEIRNLYDFVVFADTEFSIFNGALMVIDGIVSGGTNTLEYFRRELGDFGVKATNAMVAARVDPTTEPIYAEVMTFSNWERPLPGVKIPLPNKFVPYVAARKKRQGGQIALGHVYVFQNTVSGYFLDFEGPGHKEHALAWPSETGGSRWRLIGDDMNHVLIQSEATKWFLDYVGPHNEEQLSTVIAVPEVTGGSTWRLIEEGDSVRIRNAQTSRYLDYVGPHKEDDRRKLIAIPDQTDGGRWKYQRR